MQTKRIGLISDRSKSTHTNPSGASRGLNFAIAKELLLTTTYHIMVRSRRPSHGDDAARLGDGVSALSLDRTLATNVSGQARVTKALFLLLLDSAEKAGLRPRLVFVSSSLGSLSYNGDSTSRHSDYHTVEYRVSKAAIHMLLVEYHMALPVVTLVGAALGSRITRNADALRKMGAVEPEVRARILPR
ncbi:uncharacterized protein BO97DRAFT_434374 [Aspergillus homomorphus CBS 101889]|uniref:NAD(P)-binding protein n=1 Tax=Aspergillus homomorphus (strain CBS 101889) TaxID=1450537 RepID=A0A395HY13_ASPHC|nr:hypothetical protein BO97DRAFT_434374 [Aspergillus homomorphus CBS 101889]RAL12389.1 hypothetical protein BO97DRAFT_434374 [Aspergillus homomorphus CBS 101889]